MSATELEYTFFLDMHRTFTPQFQFQVTKQLKIFQRMGIIQLCSLTTIQLGLKVKVKIQNKNFPSIQELKTNLLNNL